MEEKNRLMTIYMGMEISTCISSESIIDDFK